MKRIAVIMIGAMILFFYLTAAQEKKAPADPVRIEKLSDWFDGVSFSHAKHSGAECGKCHHMGFDAGPGCLSCHPKEKTFPSEVSLKDAYHGVCLPCHTAKDKDVKEGCENCHKSRNLPSPKGK